MKRRRAVGLLATMLAACIAACTPLPKPTLSSDDQSDLDRIAAYLNAMPRFQARFTQSGDYGPGAGLVWVDRPGNLRIDYQGAAARVMVIAGGRVHVLDRGNGATTTMPVSRTPLGILLEAPLHLDGTVHVDGLQHGPSTLRLTLSKTGAPAQGSLTLDFNDAPLLLRAVSVTDAYHRVLTMQLSGIDTNPALTQALFVVPQS